MADPEPDRPEPPSAATRRLREFLARDVPHAEIAVRLGLPLVEAKRRIAALGGLAGEGRSAKEPDGGTERRQPERVASPPVPNPEARPPPEPAGREPRRISRRALLGVATGAAVALAGGGFLATRPTRGTSPSGAGASLRPIPTPIPPRPPPLALARETEGVFAPLSFAPGRPIDAAHGIFFLRRDGAGERPIEGWQQQEAESAPPRSQASPGRRFVAAGNALLDRKMGRQFTWPGRDPTGVRSSPERKARDWGEAMVRAELLERSKELGETPILDRIANMREELLAGGDEAQQLRHLPAWVAQKLIDAGIYRMAMPQELGGEDLRARAQIEVIEASAAIDGSVGWCVQINSEINALVLRQVDPAFAHEICDDWNFLVCSGLGPANGPNPGRVTRRESDGWRVNYQGSFASGCHAGTWNLILSPAVMNEAGEPAEASFMVPRGEFEIVDTWDMAGLRGSGSHDVRITGPMPPKHTLPQAALGPSTHWGNPTYRNPTQVPYNKAAVALGICRGTIDEFTDLALGKTPWGSGTLLKDMPEAQYRLGEAEATWRASRAFLMEAEDEIEEHLGPLPADGGRAMPEWEFAQRARLACIHASQATRHIVDVIHNTAGTTGSRMESPLERKLRDAHQAAAHGGISWRHYTDLGKTLLGHDPPANYSAVTRA